MAIDLEANEQAMWDNADFEEVGSVAKARAYITAATRYINHTPESASDQGSSLSINKASIRENIRRAQAFIAANSRRQVRFLGPGGSFR
jgi:hypothetical protein